MASLQRPVAIAFALGGLLSAGVAVVHERRMQRHRLPGVTYADVTFRKDGGWRRDDLFTPEGLAAQRRASRAGLTALLCWLLSLASWILLAG